MCPTLQSPPTHVKSLGACFPSHSRRGGELRLRKMRQKAGRKKESQRARVALSSHSGIATSFNLPGHYGESHTVATLNNWFRVYSAITPKWSMLCGQKTRQVKAGLLCGKPPSQEPMPPCRGSPSHPTHRQRRICLPGLCLPLPPETPCLSFPLLPRWTSEGGLPLPGDHLSPPDVALSTFSQEGHRDNLNHRETFLEE